MNRTIANAAALALAGALALQLAACGTAQQPAAEQTSTQPDPVALTMSWWGDDARTEAYRQAVQTFEAKLQYITVETTCGAAADEDQTADVMQVDWTWLGQNADRFVDLNDYSDVIDLEQFSQSALDACTVDGALLAVPMSVTGRIFYWNTRTFEQAGIDAPKTYEELLAAGSTFRDVLGEEYYPLALDEAARMNWNPPPAKHGWRMASCNIPRMRSRPGWNFCRRRKKTMSCPPLPLSRQPVCRAAQRWIRPPCGRTASMPVPLPGMLMPRPTAAR